MGYPVSPNKVVNLEHDLRSGSGMAHRDGEPPGGFTAHCRAEYGSVVTHLFAAGRTGARLMRMERGGGDFSTPATNDLVLCMPKTIGVRLRRDFGAGQFDAAVVPDGFGVISPGVSAKALDDAANVVLTFSVPYQNLLDIASGDGGLPSDGDFGAVHGGLNVDRTVVQRVDGLFSELSRGNPRGSLYAESTLLYLAARLLDLRAGSAAQHRGAIGGLAPWQVRRVKDMLTSGLAESISLSQLADEVRLSSSHFARAFKTSTGMSPHRWQTIMRLERAKVLLETTDLPVTEVAAEVGYNDTGYFGRAFRQEYGFTPTAYRRERRA
jgi:AraC family transcriptional regulator